MAKKRKKNIREKGKIRVSDYFKKLSNGDKVSIVQEKSFSKNFPDRIVGLTGVVSEERGEYKIVEIKDGEKSKKFIIHPLHLQKIK